MADSGLAYDLDRLPWLTDDGKPRRPRRKHGSTPLLLEALLAAIFVAGGSYWLGMQSAASPDAFSDSTPTGPVATVRLPEPQAVELSPAQVRPAPMPDVQPTEAPQPIRIARAEPLRATAGRPAHRAAARPKARTVSRLARVRAPHGKRRVAVKRPAPTPAWPAAVSKGADGRVVRIGTYSSRRQAKLAWWRLVRHYPGMERLKAVVAPVPSLRNRQDYYRLQFGTTSQAQSEVLCQHMRSIAQSCVVVGLPRR